MVILIYIFKSSMHMTFWVIFNVNNINDLTTNSTHKNEKIFTHFIKSHSL